VPSATPGWRILAPVHPPLRGRDARLAGLFVLAMGLMTTRGLDSGDAAVHLALASSLLTDGDATLAIDPADLWVPSRPVAGGLFWMSQDGLRSASAPGAALLSLVFVAPATIFADGAIAEVLDPLFADPGALGARALFAPIERDPRAIAFALVGPLCAALAVLFLALCCRALELSRSASWLAVGGLALGSPLLAYAGTCWTQLPVVAALSFALWQSCLRERRPSRNPTWLGVALAIAIAVRPDSLAYVPFFGLTAFRTEQRWRRSPSRNMARFLAPILVACVALAAWGLPERGEGWALERLAEGASGLLLSPRTGLLVFAPFAILAPLGVIAIRDRAPPLAWIVAGPPLLALVMYGGWFDWSASLAYGPRFLVPVLPSLALALGVAADRHRAALVSGWVLVALGFAIELPGALLMHARIDEPDAWWHLSVLDAYARLLSGEGAIGALGLDCASTYVIAYPVATLLVAILGILASRNRRTG
jgi:hypothetical protein